MVEWVLVRTWYRNRMAESMMEACNCAVDGGELPIRNSDVEFAFVPHQGRLATEMGHV